MGSRQLPDKRGSMIENRLIQGGGEEGEWGVRERMRTGMMGAAAKHRFLEGFG